MAYFDQISLNAPQSNRRSPYLEAIRIESQTLPQRKEAEFQKRIQQETLMAEKAYYADQIALQREAQALADKAALANNVMSGINTGMTAYQTFGGKEGLAKGLDKAKGFVTGAPATAPVTAPPATGINLTTSGGSKLAPTTISTEMTGGAVPAAGAPMPTAPTSGAPATAAPPAASGIAGGPWGLAAAAGIEAIKPTLMKPAQKMGGAAPKVGEMGLAAGQTYLATGNPYAAAVAADIKGWESDTGKSALSREGLEAAGQAVLATEITGIPQTMGMQSMIRKNVGKDAADVITRPDKAAVKVAKEIGEVFGL